MKRGISYFGRIAQWSIALTLIVSSSHASSILFLDGFESGKTSKWSVATGYVTTLNPRSGAYCIAVPYEDGQTHMMRIDLGVGIAPTNEFFIRFWVKIGANYHAPYLGWKWIRLKHGQVDGIQAEFFCNSESWGTQVVSYQTGGFHDNPSLNWNWYTGGMADGNWHKVEVFGKYNTDSQANGILRVWGDGNLKFESTSFVWRTDTWANDTFKLFYLPSNAGDGTHRAQSGDIIYYDDIEIWDGMPFADGKNPPKPPSGLKLIITPQ